MPSEKEFYAVPDVYPEPWELPADIKHIGYKEPPEDINRLYDVINRCVLFLIIMLLSRNIIPAVCFLLLMPRCVAQKMVGNIITPMHRKIKLLWAGKSGSIQWDQDGKIKVLKKAFSVKEHDVIGYPRFAGENKNYIVLRYGCGSPCWVEIFLPLYKNGNPTIVEEPLAHNLDIDRVVSPGGTNWTLITIENLRTHKKQSFYPDSCNAAFIGYCIDTAYFEGNKFIYYWNDQAAFGRQRSIKNKRSVELK